MEFINKEKEQVDSIIKDMDMFSYRQRKYFIERMFDELSWCPRCGETYDVDELCYCDC